MYATGAKNNVSDRDVSVVDLRSDTLSKPTPEMLEAMVQAALGDDVYHEDPTVNKLEARCAELFKKEAALFVPSGTMGNLIGMMVHCNERGSEAICGDLSHTFLYEQGGAAYLGGIQLNLVPNNPDGTFCLETVKQKIRGFDCHEPKTKLVIVENTHNMCGGKVLPLSFLSDLWNLAKENNLKVHMDGARVFNASEYLGIPVSEIGKYVDSVTFCLSKGLSCPVGSIVVGTSEFIESARRIRKALGGGMRQVGVLAATGLVALDTIVPKLKLDHAKCFKIAKAIHDLKSPNFDVDVDNVQSNIMLINIKNKKITAEHLTKRCFEVTDEEIKAGVVDSQGKGIVVRLSSRDWAYARIVLYQQVTEEQVDLAIKKLCFVIRELDERK